MLHKLLFSLFIPMLSSMDVHAHTCEVKSYKACTPEHHPYPCPRLSVEVDNSDAPKGLTLPTPSLACKPTQLNGNISCCMSGGHHVSDHGLVLTNKTEITNDIKLPMCNSVWWGFPIGPDHENATLKQSSTHTHVGRQEGLPEGNYKKNCRACEVQKGENNKRTLKCQCGTGWSSEKPKYKPMEVDLEVKRQYRWEVKSKWHKTLDGMQPETKLYKVEHDNDWILVY